MPCEPSQQHANAPTSYLIPMEASWTELATSVFTHSHDGIIVTDTRGRILEINKAFTVATGYSRSEVLGKNPRLLQSGQHGIGFYAELWKELRDKGVWRGEMVNRRKDGRIVTELLTISAVHTEEGRLSRYVGIFSDITELKERQRQLEQLAHFDGLTGLPNRVLLMDRMRHMLAWAERHYRQVAVCYLDLDGFKDINDRHGHHMGDKVLVEVARRLRSKIRNGDTVARLGGDEFVLLLAEPGTAEDVRATLGRMIKNLAKPIHENPSIVISASIGVAIFPADHGDPDTLLQHADQAMYRVKKAGRVT
jgi:diguanylate cyclase (GGDEF)-like protein/PAS domain S-box-containing protein